ncbi:MAG TPA: hypothetical protein VFX58_06975 [Chitinophagaceae bacterium]|nr:hypothetical protein [Chitinophagaceae bacterium]
MKSIVIAITFSITLASCTPGKMSVSEELKSQHDEYAVKGRNGTRINQKLSFGEYVTTEIKRSWTKGNSFRSGIGYSTAQQEWVNIISTEYINRKQTIRFSLAGGKHHSEVFCVSRFNAKDLEIGKNPNSVLNIGMDILGIGGHSSSTYYVQVFASEKDDRPWEMVIDNQLSQARPKEYIGYLAKSQTEYYSIIPVTRMEKNGKSGNILVGSIGFEFHDPQGRAVAAVSFIEKGMVFLGRSNPEERFLLANACTALLLQDIIE